jgi:hypothetical protein
MSARLYSPGSIRRWAPRRRSSPIAFSTTMKA